MTKLSEEIRKETDDAKRDVILNFVSHIDLKKEYKLLVDEMTVINRVAANIKEEKPKPVKKVKKKAKKEDDESKTNL
jgi:hypothetical protein